ncbi:MAG: hypothetical protein A3J07_03005 [Candidatus Doudnabacteria bacterium RIFCSPLOWO2_02_FULL_49_13]|uniref:PpiC domain-containing protein n=1 Tax=Candidatus Doudnabacteria bacterium RIFCSPHIGHO2_12_FULL_48_16 TaxID=1817838 RepID=A0A1F5PLR8_9BACT|nr:MAG: hypothetical protein A3B77_01810 [Candidatus Doudnabacteria bacterium RIFCSPHIGHO2_02_FULL_49_24]OGE89456.1 MAG: hypothetical protein A2760_02465 [Candidatus Doudnabacteria bacterium RIFCSPHIGHO2_01_FULL_50_67]OGE90851.1 MAG: hypothetical protein A3E29_01625 [Candidatus Doudnabacteria bacterium RIFCSPHIGHO2_12_FULL_48_16]OGE97562.1 MAG: hypothetical protein A2990_02485 [Candidatus Doudnabacteria bacterium RIFCSPLOWO2_01_FULL_49_40]OGF03034.1 MAG: hypothetical protein A3J07_03005 [Candid
MQRQISNGISKKFTHWHAGAAIVLLFAIVTVLAYTTNWPLLQRIYPAVMIKGRFITLKAWADAQTVAAKFDQNFNREALLDQQIKTEEEKQLVWNLGLGLSRQDVDAELRFLKFGQEQKYTDLLQSHFGSESENFERFVALPRIYDAKLRVKYNSDHNYGTNFDDYNRAINILSEVKASENFDAIAAEKSDDKVTGQLGGDLGFVSLDQLIPELAEKIRGLAIGRVADQIVVSRWGYHILYPVETAQREGQTVYHIKQILVQTSGYDNWLNPQLKDFSVWRIK